jgi:hypothetical protein
MGCSASGIRQISFALIGVSILLKVNDLIVNALTIISLACLEIVERAMHNELAWRVLGVDPETQKAIEHSARQEGVSLGRFLEKTMAAPRNAAVHKLSVEQATRKRDERLRDVMSDMAESLMAASDMLRSGLARKQKAVELDGEQADRNEVRQAQSSSPKKDDPFPNVEELQSWLRALNERSAKSVEQRKPSRFSVMRRSA